MVRVLARGIMCMSLSIYAVVLYACLGSKSYSRWIAAQLVAPQLRWIFTAEIQNLESCIVSARGNLTLPAFSSFCRHNFSSPSHDFSPVFFPPLPSDE